MRNLSHWTVNHYETVASCCIGLTMFYWLQKGETIGTAFFSTMLTFWMPLIVTGLIAEILQALVPRPKSNR